MSYSNAVLRNKGRIVMRWGLVEGGVILARGLFWGGGGGVVFYSAGETLED